VSFVDVVSWLVGVVLIALCASTVLVVALSRHWSWRWGTVRGPARRAGEGAYRSAETRPMRPRGVPARVRWAAGTSIAWGVVTLLVFAPAGALLVALLADGGNDAAVLVLPLLLVVVDGLVLPFGLFAAAGRLLRNSPGSTDGARRIATWSTIHHAAVLLVMAALGISELEALMLLLMSGVPCGIGLAQAWLLGSVGGAQADGDRSRSSLERQADGLGGRARQGEAGGGQVP